MSNGYCRFAFVGKFKLNRQIMCEEPDMVAQLLSQGIVLRAEMLFHNDSIEYIMYSPTLFRELEEGEEVPEYGIQVGQYVDEDENIIGFGFNAEEY